MKFLLNTSAYVGFKRIKEAIELCVEVEDVPITTEFVGLQRIAVPV